MPGTAGYSMQIAPNCKPLQANPQKEWFSSEYDLTISLGRKIVMDKLDFPERLG